MTSDGTPGTRAFVEWLAEQDPDQVGLTLPALIERARQSLAHENEVAPDTAMTPDATGTGTAGGDVPSARIPEPPPVSGQPPMPPSPVPPPQGQPAPAGTVGPSGFPDPSAYAAPAPYVPQLPPPPYEPAAPYQPYQGPQSYQPSQSNQPYQAPPAQPGYGPPDGYQGPPQQPMPPPPMPQQPGPVAYGPPPGGYGDPPYQGPGPVRYPGPQQGAGQQPYGPPRNSAGQPPYQDAPPYQGPQNPQQPFAGPPPFPEQQPPQQQQHGGGVPAAMWAINPLGSAVIRHEQNANQSEAAAAGPGYQPPLIESTGGAFAQARQNGLLPQDMTNDQIGQMRAQMPSMSPFFDPNGTVGEKNGLRQTFGSGLLPGWDSLAARDRLAHMNSLPRWAQEMLWSQMTFKQRRKFNVQRMNRPGTQF